MKYIKEFFFFSDPEIKPGDMLLCKKDYGFAGAYRQLPRLYDFESGKKYKVLEADDNSVTIESDQGTYFSKNDKNKSTHILSMNKKDINGFLYIWDYFEKPKK